MGSVQNRIGFGLLLVLTASLSFTAVFFFTPYGDRAAVVRAQFRNLLQRAAACTEQLNKPGDCRAIASAVVSALDTFDVSHFALSRNGIFDVHILDNIVIVMRRPCSPGDIRKRIVAWSLWSTTTKVLSPTQTAEGEFGRFLSFEEEGHVFSDSCLLISRLPTAKMRRIFLSVLDETRSKIIWKIDHTFAPGIL